MPSWEEIKAVLDSPYVSADKKNRIMQAYDKDTFNFNDEQEEYAKKYLKGYAEADIDLSYDFGLGGDALQTAYDDAKADMDAGLAQEQQGVQAKDQAKSALDALTSPAPAGGGARNSNELLDQGKPTCDFLCQWIDQIWNRRPAGGTLDYMKEIWGRYNQDRNIDFQKFLAAADDLSNAHKVNEDTMAAAKAELGTLFGEWQGQGATAARVEFEEKIQPAHQKLQEQIDGAATLIPRTVRAVFDAIKTKVDAVLGLYRTTVAHAPLEMANKVVTIARKETDSKEDLLDVAGWVDSVCGSNLAERLQSDDCGLNDENRDYAYDLCARWVANSFTPEFQGLLDAFNNYCETARSTVEQQFGALADYLSGYHNEFTEPARSESDKPAHHEPQGGQETGALTGGGGGSLPSAAVPAAGDPAGTAKQEAEPGSNPVTGGALQIDPHTGEPYPIDPRTGEAITDADGPETVTVQQGDNRIEMSEPDAEGRMEIKIGDGHGDVRDYTLDWGDGAQSGQAAGPAGQAVDPAGQAAGPAGQAISPAGQAADPVGQDGDPAARIYTPGPDGKIHIQDGNLAVTVERPQGPHGPTVVTVDDGTGKPTTYTLGHEGVAEPAQHHPGTGAFTAPGGLDVAHAIGTPQEGGPAATPDGTQVADGLTEEGSGTGLRDQTTPAAASGSPVSPEQHTGEDAAGSLGHSGFGSVSGDGGSAEPEGQPGSVDTGGQDGSADPRALAAGAQVGVSLEVGADQGQPAPAVLGTAPPAAHPATGQGAALGGSGFGGTSGGSGGLGMLGGMGFGGMGAGGEADQERSSRAYRVDGGIFDTSTADGRISGLLEDEEDSEVRL